MFYSKIRLTLLLLCCQLCFTTISQEPYFEWVVSQGYNLSDDAGYAVEIDLDDNVISVGFFRGTVNFDPSLMAPSLVSEGGEDIFIQALGANTNYILKVIKQ